MKKLKTTKDLLVGDLIEEAKSKMESKTVTAACWVDGEKIIDKYCIGRGIEAYTEEEAIAQYVKEKVLEIL